MSKLTGALGDAAKESALANYYRWEEPYSHITVCLNLDTADYLQAEVLGGIGSFPEASIEIGGILLGRTEREEGRTVTVIEDFEPVPCEHRHGPFYSLSAEDLVKLRGSLARRRSGASRGRSVVGYYRSHHREDLFLSADDLAVIRTCFRNPDSIFLLIKAVPGRMCTAGFFFWNNGRIQSEFTDSEVALIPIGQRPDPVLTSDVPSGDFGGLEEPQAIPSLEPSRSRRRVIGGLALSAAAAAVILAALRFYETGGSPRFDSPRPVLATNSTGTLPTAPAEPLAESAAEPLTKPLAKPPVQDRTARGTLAAIPAPQRIPVSHTADIQPNILGPQKTEGGVAAGPSDGQQNIPVVAGASDLPHATADNERDSATKASRADEGVRPAEPPAAQNVPPLALDQQRPVAAVPTPPPLPVPTPVENRFVGPQIIHKASPAIPLGVGSRITTAVQIDVTVTIDEDGKVTGARVTSSRGAAAGLLTLEALKAAQLFRFRPAEENNRRVRSEMVLTFRFAPKAL
jgi:TonB family protein